MFQLIDNAIMRLATSTSGKALTALASEAVGEGVEEYLSEVVGAYLVKLYDEEARGKSFGETFTEAQGDAFYSFLIGALTSAVLSGPGAITQTSSETATPPVDLMKNTIDTQALADTALPTEVAQVPVVDPAAITTPDGVATTDTHTAAQQQTIQEYLNAVDPEIVEFVYDVRENPDGRWPGIQTSAVSAREAADIQALTGVDVSGYVHNISRSAINHIENRHGVNGKADSSMANIEDVARIDWVLNNYDYISEATDVESDALAKGYLNSDGTHAPKIMYQKAIDGVFYVIEAVPITKTKRLQLVTAYITKRAPQNPAGTLSSEFHQLPDVQAPRHTSKNEADLRSELETYQVPDVQAPGSTSETASELVSNISIPQSPDSATAVTENLHNFGPNTVGAAEHVPGSYYDLMMQYGQLPPGENPTRVLDVPAKTSPNENVSLAARTLMESDIPVEHIADLERAVVDGEFSYFPQTNQAAMDKAVETIQDKGFARALDLWESRTEDSRYRDNMTTKDRLQARMGKNAVNVNDLALAIQLYKEALDAKDYRLASRLAVEIAAQGHVSGQLVQAMRLIKKATPAGQLYYLETTADKLQNDMKLRFGDKAKDIVIDEVLKQNLLNATNQAEVDAAVEAIKKNIADQMPSTWMDKWNAWRYLSMLGNVKTHARNILGNAAFIPARKIKNMLATAIEGVANAVTNGDIGRTKAILTPADRALVDFGRSDYSNIQDHALGVGKYHDANNLGDINDYRTIFKFKPVEWARKFNSKALDIEDIWFNRPAYAESLASYMKANDLTPEFLNSGTTEASKALWKARAYAIKEAQKATATTMRSRAFLAN